MGVPAESLTFDVQYLLPEAIVKHSHILINGNKITRVLNLSRIFVMYFVVDGNEDSRKTSNTVETLTTTHVYEMAVAPHGCIQPCGPYLVLYHITSYNVHESALAGGGML